MAAFSPRVFQPDFPGGIAGLFATARKRDSNCRSWAGEKAGQKDNHLEKSAEKKKSIILAKINIVSAKNRQKDHFS